MNGERVKIWKVAAMTYYMLSRNEETYEEPE
jgi:hypothetical protein